MTENAIGDKINEAAKEETSAVFEWVPCSERLPKIKGWYLVSNDEGRVQTLYFNTNKQRWVQNAVKHVFDTYDVRSKFLDKSYTFSDVEEGCYNFHPHIIAWMPLPPPYVEKEIQPDCPWR